MHILIDGERHSIDTDEERLQARLALADADLERAPIHPEDGREFCADGLFSYYGAIGANSLMLEIHEFHRAKHSIERSPRFMGYTAIPAHFVLLSLTEALCRPSTPDSAKASWNFEECIADTMVEGELAVSIDRFDAELDAYAQAEPAPTSCIEITLNASGLVTLAEQW